MWDHLPLGRVPRIGLLLIVGLLGWITAPRRSDAATSWEQSAEQIECYDFLELTLTLDEASSSNPFVDADFTVEVQEIEGGGAGTPSPITKVDGFCDSSDGRVFRARFMPGKCGAYRFTQTFRCGDVELTNSGRFTVVDGSRPGPVRVDPEHPFHFVRVGSGEHWFWNGTTTYMLLGWDDETIERSVTRLADLGVNRLRVAICGRPKDGTRWNEPLVTRTEKFAFKMEPWVAARPDNLEDPGYDVTRFNVPFFQKAERMLRLARHRDVMISAIFYVDGRDAGVDPFGKEGMGGDDEQRYYRYVASRFSAFSNVMWDVSNEYHLFRDEAWVNRMGAFLKTCDPYDHLMSVHGHGSFAFRMEPWADFAMYQCWDEHGGYDFMLENRRLQQETGRVIPQINEEYGYEDHYPFPWGQARLWPARTADTRRRLAWEMTMAGCYQTTGERANDGTGAGLDDGGGWINGRGSSRMTMLIGYGHLRRFFEGFEWWKLEPRGDLLQLPPERPRSGDGKRTDAAPPIPVLRSTAMLLAEPGRRYVIYMPQGGSACVKVADGDYRGRWFNPRSGQFLTAAADAVGGLWNSPPAPDAEDWTLLLESTAEPAGSTP